MTYTRRITNGFSVTVLPWESAVVTNDSGAIRAEGVGKHSRGPRQTWHIVDTRPSWLTIAPQEVLTSDSLQVRITPVVRYRVSDATLWVTGAQESSESLYVLAQLALREAVSGNTLDDLVVSRNALFADARTQLTTAAESLGAEVLDFEIRDLTLPAELRHALAETALAREQGKARLERARAEAASLRSLANSAQLLEAHPALLELRAIEAAGASGQFIVRIGNTGNPDS